MVGNKELSKNKGLTLLEVMLAVCILSIGLLSIVSLFGTSHRVLAISEQKSLAAQLARNKMEGLRTQRPLPVNQEEEIAGTGMTRRWSIAQSTNEPRLWIIIVEAFPTKNPKQSVLLKSVLFY